MNPDEFPSPIQNRNVSSAVSTTETNFQQQQQQQRKEGLATKLRQTINSAGKRVQSARQRKFSVPDLMNLTPQSQVRYPGRSF